MRREPSHGWRNRLKILVDDMNRWRGVRHCLPSAAPPRQPTMTIARAEADTDAATPLPMSRRLNASPVRMLMSDTARRPCARPDSGECVLPSAR